MWASVYPPPTLILLAPLAKLPPRAAMTTWTMLILLGIALDLWVLSKMAGLRSGGAGRDGRSWLLMAGALAAAPVQFGILAGQPGMVAVSLVVLSAYLASPLPSRIPSEPSRRRRELLGGALLGIACALKPQVAAPFVLFYLASRRWRVGGTALCLAAIITIASVIAMEATNPGWASAWRDNLAAALEPGSINDRAPGGPYRDEIIDLQVLTRTLWQHAFTAQVVSAALVAVLIGWYVRAGGLRRHSSPVSELLALSSLAAMSLLPVYHRVYDAAVLLFAFAWALQQLEEGRDARRRWVCWAALLPLAVFLVPFDLLSSVLTRSELAREVSNSWWWHALVVPHYAWGALLITLALLWAQHQQQLRPRFVHQKT